MCSGEKPHQSVEAKADLLFELDTGKGVCGVEGGGCLQLIHNTRPQYSYLNVNCPIFSLRDY